MKGRVLVVDDDEGSRMAVEQAMTSRLSCDVALAECASVALARFESEHFDVIVSDYQMPEMTGLDFALELRKRNDSIPLLLYSAHAISEFDPQKLQSVTDVISKPNVQDLVLKVSVLMNWPIVSR